MAEAKRGMTISEGRATLRLCNSTNALSDLIDLWQSGALQSGDWLRLLGEQWTGFDNVHLYATDLLKRTPFLWGRESALRPLLMTTEELAAYGRLPATITLYRGAYKRAAATALSWSLDVAVAARFPFLTRYRRPGRPMLLTGLVRKRDVLMVKLDREEAEVVPYPVQIMKSHILAAWDDPARQRRAAPDHHNTGGCNG